MLNEILKYSKVLSTREWATIIWLFIFLIYILKNKKIKEQFLNVINILFGKVLIKIWIATFIYVFFITFLFSKTLIWNNFYIKDIIIWFITSGIIFSLNAASKEADEQYIWTVLKDNLKLTIFLEFFLNTFTFSFWIELLLIPIIALLTIIDEYTAIKEEYKIIHKFMQIVIAFIIIWIFYETFKIGLREYKELNILNTFVSFFIPIVYLLLILPLEYLIEVYSKYDTLFMGMFFKKNIDKNIISKYKFLIIKKCGLSLRHILLFQKNYYSRIDAKMSDNEFIILINKIIEEK